jgi:hypothetical protein
MRDPQYFVVLANSSVVEVERPLLTISAFHKRGDRIAGALAKTKRQQHNSKKETYQLNKL